METTKIGIREFRAGMAAYLASDTPVAITRHGQTVGFFIPAHGLLDASIEALKQTAAELDRQLAAQAVDVEEVAAEFKAARKTNKKPGAKAA